MRGSNTPFFCGCILRLRGRLALGREELSRQLFVRAINAYAVLIGRSRGWNKDEFERYIVHKIARNMRTTTAIIKATNESFLIQGRYSGRTSNRHQIHLASTVSENILASRVPAFTPPIGPQICPCCSLRRRPRMRKSRNKWRGPIRTAAALGDYRQITRRISGCRGGGILRRVPEPHR